MSAPEPSMPSTIGAIKRLFLCIVGSHTWCGCTCTKCGYNRGREHNWVGCVCKTCNGKRDSGHDWRGCVCAMCGCKRNSNHDWRGCICATCGKKRGEGHDWTKNCQLCSLCGLYLESREHQRERVEDPLIPGCTVEGPCLKCGRTLFDDNMYLLENLLLDKPVPAVVRGLIDLVDHGMKEGMLEAYRRPIEVGILRTMERTNDPRTRETLQALLALSRNIKPYPSRTTE